MDEVKEISNFFEENISILNFLDYGDYDKTEIGFMCQYDGFDSLDVALLNHQNYTKEELEVIKNLIIERDNKLLSARGRNIHDEYPDTELFENMDYTSKLVVRGFDEVEASTFEKLKIDELNEKEKSN